MDFSSKISKAMRHSTAINGKPDCIVLTRTSMPVVTDSLGNLGILILSSIILAIQKVTAAVAS